MSNQELEQWTRNVQAAFPDDLARRIILAPTLHPVTLPQLFEDIAQHVLSLHTPSTAQDTQPLSKKRKLEDNHAFTTTESALPKRETKPLSTLFECSDVSVQAPLRKKLKVALLYDSAAKEEGQIHLSNASTGEVEWGMEAKDVEQAFRLPVPEKQARQANFLLFPKPGAVDMQGHPAEPVLFVTNETTPGAGTISGEAVKEDDTYVSVTHRALDKWLSPHGKHVITPNAAEFASSIPQSHRKGEKAYHVKAHRGSKEGRAALYDVHNAWLTDDTRLPLLPRKRRGIRLQEAPGLLPLLQHRFHQLYLRPATHLQPRHRRGRQRERGSERSGVQHAGSRRLCRHRCICQTTRAE